MSPIAVPAATGAVALPFSFNVIGSGSAVVGEVSIANGAGTAFVEGRTLAVLPYERQPFEDYVLYQSLAVAPETLYVLWFYCLGGELLAVYYESTNGLVVGSEAATGACAESATPSAPSVSFPALTLPYPATVAGFDVSGPSLAFAGGAPGTLTAAGRSYVWLPFNEVDCSACADPGWYELHSILWDGSQACFAIVYLLQDGIQLDYALCLPDLDDPFGALLLDGSWQRTL